MAERIGRGLQRFFHADGADQHFPLAIGDRQRHHAAAVGRVERVAVGAIQEIAIGLAVGVVDFDLGQIAEVRGFHHRARLLAQVQRQVPVRPDRLAGAAAALPAAEGLVTGPGARGRALRAGSRR
jgi:hypothetical protein